MSPPVPPFRPSPRVHCGFRETSKRRRGIINRNRRRGCQRGELPVTEFSRFVRAQHTTAPPGRSTRSAVHPGNTPPPRRPLAARNSANRRRLPASKVAICPWTPDFHDAYPPINRHQRPIPHRLALKYNAQSISCSLGVSSDSNHCCLRADLHIDRRVLCGLSLCCRAAYCFSRELAVLAPRQRERMVPLALAVPLVMLAPSPVPRYSRLAARGQVELEVSR